MISYRSMPHRTSLARSDRALTPSSTQSVRVFSLQGAAYARQFPLPASVAPPAGPLRWSKGYNFRALGK
jgi:hypothetical protein